MSEIQELTAIAQKIYDIFFGGIKNSTFLFVNFWSIDKVLEFNIEYYDRITKEIENLEK